MSPDLDKVREGMSVILSLGVILGEGVSTSCDTSRQAGSSCVTAVSGAIHDQRLV